MKLTQAHKIFITDIKEKIRKAQYDTLRAVNAALIGLYWVSANPYPKNKKTAGAKT